MIAAVNGEPTVKRLILDGAKSISSPTISCVEIIGSDRPIAALYQKPAKAPGTQISIISRFFLNVLDEGPQLGMHLRALGKVEVKSCAGTEIVLQH